jgi:hypothetical protein
MGVEAAEYVFSANACRCRDEFPQSIQSLSTALTESNDRPEILKDGAVLTNEFFSGSQEKRMELLPRARFSKHAQ